MGGGRDKLTMKGSAVLCSGGRLYPDESEKDYSDILQVCYLRGKNKPKNSGQAQLS